MKQYYCQVAALPELAIDDVRPKISIEGFKEFYMPYLSSADARLISLFYLKYDNFNLCAFLQDGEQAKFDVRGLYTRQQLENIVSNFKTDEYTDSNIPTYFYSFITLFPQLKEQKDRLPIDVLTSMYYNYAEQATNIFVHDWFLFNRQVGNILIVSSARKHGIDATPYLIGDDEFTKSLNALELRVLKQSNGFNEFEDIIKIDQITDITAKERALDALKWNWLEQHTFFHYFTIERLFEFLVKTDIIERWSLIDEDHGEKALRDVVNELKNSVQVPAQV